jgi:uncharacterized lipoprotein YddW (UPF0748 family)
VVENIDFPAHKSEFAFKRDFRQMVQNIKNAGFNAVIFQIRSNCDAFYPTDLAPWSRWMAGQEGAFFKNFDPLKFMIDETHRHGLEFHAWFNPYRVTNKTALSKQAYLNTLSPNNFARKNPQWVLVKKHPDGNQLFLDPGVPQVVDHLAAVIADVVRRYNIDAVHFDDYFYPYEKIGNEDEQSYRLYNPKKLSRDNWRRENTSRLIWRIKQTVNRINISQQRRVKFGVSPLGIWANRPNISFGSLTGGKESYFTLYADTYSWMRNGYVDYIVPQIYWDFDHDVAAYAALTDWWSQAARQTGVKLYIGIGAYNGQKWQENELVNQVRYNRMHPEISGAAFFSYRSFFGRESNRGAARLLRFFRQR